VRASIVAGPEVAVIDVSPHGLLLETDVRLIPGAAICLNIRVNDHAHLVGGRVARVDAAISAAELKYRAGIALDEMFPPFDVVALEQAVRSATAGRPDPNRTQRPAGASAGLEATPDDWEIRALRQTLADKKRELEHALPMIDQLTDALQATDRSRREAEDAHGRERAEWERQRRTLEAEAEEARRRELESAEQALTAVREERAIAARLDHEHTAWLTERRALQQELDRAKALPDDAARELEALRGSTETMERALEKERAASASLLKENDRLLAELEAVSKGFDTLKREAEDRKRAGVEENRQLEHRLQVTEFWCAEQQELIYHLARQALQSSALIQRWHATERRPGSDGTHPADPDHETPGAEPASAQPADASAAVGVHNPNRHEPVT
jgi:chromosome segregation ATPase